MPTVSDNPTAAELALWEAGDLELARREALGKIPGAGPENYLKLQWPDAVFDEWQIRDIIKPGLSGNVAEIFIKGCTRPGKGFSVATLANAYFDLYDDARIIITSSALDHAIEVMYGEIIAVRGRMKYPGPGKVLQEGFQHNSKHYITVANPKTGEGFSGQHGGRTMFIFDEASAIHEDLYTNALKQASLIVALSNPRILSGWFRAAFNLAQGNIDKTQEVIALTGRRQLVSVDGADCLNVREKRLEKPIGPIGGIDIDGTHYVQGDLIPPVDFAKVKLLIPNQLDYGRFMQNCSDPDSRKVAVYAHGQFPKEDADLQVIMRSHLERHFKAHEDLKGQIPVEAFGLDVGASEHGDPTNLACGSEFGMRSLFTIQTADTMKVADWVITTVRAIYKIDLTQGGHPVAVDVDGLGKGVGDRLKQLGVLVIELKNGKSADVSPETYANKKTECYAEMGRRLNPLEYAEAWPMPRDNMLEDDLCAPEKIFLADGIKFRITPKERHSGMVFAGSTVREKLGRSPDKGDATVYLYAAVRTLEMTICPTLRRPLILVTEEEDREFTIKHEAKEETIGDILARLFKADDIASGEDVVEYPSFLR